jgi:hypothetical protein
MSLDLYREDVEKHSSGSPCYIADMTFYVRRIGTKQAQTQIAEIKEKLYGLFPKPKEINENEIFANWLAYYGVCNWENVTDNDDGEPMEYSEAFARQLFLNEAYWMSLNQALITHAANYENYLADQVYEESEEIKKP